MPIAHTTDAYAQAARQCMDDKDPEHGWTIRNGHQVALPYVLLALVAEQQTTNWHLDRIAEHLGEIAKAASAMAPAAPAAEPAPSERPRRLLRLRRS